MSDVISVDVEPGYYTQTRTVNVEFSDRVVEVAINKDGTPPSISKYIAYDSLNPPQPFIAIAEDGRGRVVYDGSFPKMYNQAFDTSTGSRKYLFNALEWIVDPKRDRKILFLGDLNTGNYSLKSTSPNGFRTTVDKIVSEGNYPGSVIKTIQDYPSNTLDARFAELSQYAAVLVMAAGGMAPTPISDACVDALVQYRESGGGILLITDSAPVLSTLEAAIAYGNNGGSAYAAVVTKIAVRFGAWFTNLVNRPPTQMGYIRSNFGDHFLYNGIGDDEYLAGGSDSIVRVTSDPTYPPSQVQKSFQLEPGYNVINIMSILDDGTLVPHKLEYSIVDYSMAFILDDQEVSSGQVFDAGSKDYITVSFEAIGTDVAMEGKLWIDEVMVGTVSKPLGGTPVFSPERTDRINGKDVIRINNNSVLSIRFSNPAGMELSTIVRRTIVSQSISIPLRYSEYGDLLRSLLPEPSAPSRLISNLDESDSYLRLPKAIDVSKAHMAGPYRSRIADFVVDVADFFVGNVSWRGFYLHRSNGGDGVITPDVMGDTAIRDMNASLPEPLELQVGFPKEEPTPLLPVAIYIDNIGPLYRSGYKIDDSGSLAAQRYFYTNGVSNIYNYLGTKIGQKVEFRFIYPSP